MTHQSPQINREALVPDYNRGGVFEFASRHKKKFSLAFGGLALAAAVQPSESPVEEAVIQTLENPKSPVVWEVPENYFPVATDASKTSEADAAPELILDFEIFSHETFSIDLSGVAEIEFTDLPDALGVQIPSIDIDAPMLALGELNDKPRSEWGGATGHHEFGLMQDIRFGIEMPGIGEADTAFVIAHSPKGQAGENLNDDNEYSDDTSVRVGDTVSFPLADGRIAEGEVIDLQAHIDENEELGIYHLPRVDYEDGTTGNTGIYTLKSEFFDEGRAAEFLLNAHELTGDDSLVLLFTSYGGPGPEIQWDENFKPGAHRAFHGIQGVRITNVAELHGHTPINPDILELIR